MNFGRDGGLSSVFYNMSDKVETKEERRARRAAKKAAKAEKVTRRWAKLIVG